VGAARNGEPSQEPLQVLVSPRAIDWISEADGPAWLAGREFLGREWLYQVRWNDLRLHLRLPIEIEHARGTRGSLRLRPGESARLFPDGVELSVPG
jgi:iron(III) transport system ATP-binding protein